MNEELKNNKIDMEELDGVSGGNVSQTQELYNLYMHAGPQYRQMMGRYGDNYAGAVFAALNKDFGNQGRVQFNANVYANNFYALDEKPYTHAEVVSIIKRTHNL